MKLFGVTVDTRFFVAVEGSRQLAMALGVP